jgi:hypothetical protein
MKDESIKCVISGKMYEDNVDEFEEMIKKICSQLDLKYKITRVGELFK